jgi:hypothetical protein
VNVTRIDPAALPEVMTALVVHKSPVGAHVGLLYQADDQQALRLLHQAWHYDSRAEDLGAYVGRSRFPLFWVQPGLDHFEQSDLRVQAMLAATRLEDGGIPYAFNPRDAAMSEGVVSLGTSLGLTCATFLLLLFAGADVALLDAATWESALTTERAQADEQAQRTIVEYLGSEEDPRAREHAQKLDADVGATRIRAEEVAAASSFAARPVAFAAAAPAGRQIIETINQRR